MTTFIIVRHGFSTYNRERRFTGHADAPLEDIGVRQAQRNADYVLAHYHIDRIYSSDLQRAYMTALPVAQALDLPIHTSDQLRELYLGRWEGRYIADIKREQPEAFARYRLNLADSCGEGGETKAQFRDRVTAAFASIAAENDGKTVFVAAHGGTIRYLCAAWMGIPVERAKEIPAILNASLTVVDYDPATARADFRLVSYNEHLGELADVTTG